MFISFQVIFEWFYLTIITRSLFNVINTGYKHSLFSDLRVKNIQYGFLLCHYPDTEPYNKAQ